ACCLNTVRLRTRAVPVRGNTAFPLNSVSICAPIYGHVPLYTPVFRESGRHSRRRVGRAATPGAEKDAAEVAGREDAVVPPSQVRAVYPLGALRDPGGRMEGAAGRRYRRVDHESRQNSGYRIRKT